MTRCPICHSAVFIEDGRAVCLSAGHVLRDDVGTLEKLTSNAVPEARYAPDGTTFGPREYPPFRAYRKDRS